MLGRLRARMRVSQTKNWATILSTQPRRINSYRRYLKSSHPKRALLAYLVDPVVADLEGRQPIHFSNQGLAIAWAKSLNQLGYALDIINWDDSAWQPEHKYDLMVAHGGKTTPALLKSRGSARLIYFSTGSYWQIHNRQGIERATAFLKRHGVELPADRQIADSEEQINRAADAIICLGTDAIAQTFHDFPHVTALEIAAFPDRQRLPKKDFQTAGQNFLFFAGGGNLHKGLDLLLDSFSNLEKQHLYICTSLEPAFEKFYRLALERPNIHFEGQLPLRGRRFYELIDKSAFVILPSCAEGSPGSVADCMLYGLIPVVTPAAGVWTGDAGFEITEPTPEGIVELVGRLAKLPPDDLKQRAQSVEEHTTTIQSPENFEHQLEEAIQAVVS